MAQQIKVCATNSDAPKFNFLHVGPMSPMYIPGHVYYTPRINKVIRKKEKRKNVAG